MLTDRKRLKNRNRKLKLLIGFLITILLIGGILGYVIYQMFLSRSGYISPLAQGDYKEAMTDEKNIGKIEKYLREQKIEYLEVSLSTEGYIIRLKDNEEIIISHEKNIEKQISSLQFILPRLTMEGKTFRRLDLRYDKPVIVFK